MTSTDILQIPLSIFLPSVMLLAPVAAGALRLQISSRPLSIVAKVGSIPLGAYPSLILFNELTESFDIAGSQYLRLMLGLGVLSVCISWLLVSFGETVGKKEGIRISNAVGNVSEEVKSHFLQLLDQFNYNAGKQVSGLRSAVEGFTKDITDAFNSKVKVMEDRYTHLSNKIDELFEKYAKRTENYDIMASGYNTFQKSFKSLLDDYHKDLESMKGMRTELANRIEIYEKMKQFQDERERELERREKELSDREKSLQSSLPNQAALPNQKTTLTPDDGRASRDIGDKTEEEFALTFRGGGLEAERRKAQGDPDITLLSSDGSNKVVAVVNTKSYMLYDEPKRNQRHISREDIIPEIVAAQKHKVPVMIAVKNRSNGRKWLWLLPFEQVADWKGVSTPVMLSKNDTESGNELKEIFQKVLRQLGTKV
ncbi:MAG: hypothetical protein M1368_07055 [Thaumarchaeota archaeon]|nr:hypothetical protein [Nitrososphaerota archaeon]